MRLDPETEPLRAVLLDVDGTLVDSNDAHAESWQRTLAQHGIDVPFERIRGLIGKGGEKLLPEVSGIEADSERGKALLEERRKLFLREYAPRLRAFPWVRELLQRFHDSGLRLVTASSANEEELNVLIEIAGAKDLLYESTSSDDAERSKPDPDIVHAALKRAECEPAEALFVGDTPYDVEASRSAGVPIVAFRCGGHGDDALKGAVAIYDGAEDLLAHWETSPFARRAR